VRVDVAIVGGGIAGVALAARLAPHLEVALVEREPALGSMTTARSAAMFLPSYRGPDVGPLTRASRAFLTAALDPIGVIFQPRQALHVGRLPHLAQFGLTQAADVPLEALSPRQAVNLFPILREDVIDGAWLEAEAGDIDVAALLDLFRRMALEAGAHLMVDTGEPGIERRGDGWRLAGAHGTLEARILVNAAGPWADALAEAAGVAPLGLTPLRRTVVLAPPVAREGFSAWPIVKDVRERFYFRPYHGALLITPADAQPSRPCDAAPEKVDIARAILRFETMCDHRVARVERSWAGLRTFARDRAPVIGWAPDAPSFFWLAGLGGFGVQTSPAVSQLAASLILGEETPAELTAHGVDPRRYAPARLAS
jgi:D-arginine dehydrogenase